MKRIAVKIAYLGKDFHGSQIQPGSRTVEGDILSDLLTIMKKPKEWFNLRMAGRTDRGVNALGNVAVFNTEFEDIEELLGALNAVSKGVYYRSFAEVNDDFNPRHANARVYRYVLPASVLNIQRVHDCAQLFVGEHDFKHFCKADERSTIMTIDSIDVREDGERIVLEFTADHFLWNMIRRISAAIQAAGYDTSIDHVKQTLESGGPGFGLARPDALTLYDVRYDGLVFKDVSSFSDRVEEECFVCSLESDFLSALRE